MTNAGREPSRADYTGDVDVIVSAYVAESGGDLWLALRRLVVDALLTSWKWSATAAAPRG